jgi:hypothetical protein
MIKPICTSQITTANINRYLMSVNGSIQIDPALGDDALGDSFFGSGFFGSEWGSMMYAIEIFDDFGSTT